ncbi:dethiobiotin synthase [Sulfurovum sp. bin170]|uniref:dethiobiotin synthase n=1 Tax=Sulfurovum sp. bin170 TaxID=2695268 RepID=UPI0013E07B46|nr:dethiobiotin synthase [Sulfurovum sp. bin170]
MKLLFITATNTNIGKTFASLSLIEHFSKQGLTVGVCKPIETGITEIVDGELRVESGLADATKLLRKVQEYNENFKALKPIDITAYTFSLPASPFSADINRTIQIENIKSKIKQLSKLCDLLIIEGAGGLMVPITKDYMMIDLAKDLNAKTLLVTPSKLGCINDTLLSIEALKNRGISFDWCVNLFEDRDEFEEVTKPFYDAYFNEWWSLEDKGVDLINKILS